MILFNKIMGKRFLKMGTIICQSCENTIDKFEDEKVTVLYGKCPNCCNQHAHELIKK